MPDSPVDRYIAACAGDAQPVLREILRTIRAELPGAAETLSYDVPAFALNGKTVVQLAAWKRHVSIYPVPRGDEALQARIAPYRAGKGTLRFPLAQPVPLELIASVVKQLAAKRHASG